MKTYEKIIVAGSILLFIYLSFLIHWDILDAGVTPGRLFAASICSITLGFLIFLVNMITWGVDYQFRGNY